MFRKMFQTPGSIVVYVSINRDVAKRNIWQRLQVMNERYALGLLANHSDLTMRDPATGSVLWVLGLATQAEISKLRGNRYDLVVVDENQDILIDFESFIKSVIIPALGDRRGQLVLAGTPDPWRRNKYWYCAVTSKEKAWARFVRHSWLLTDNVFFADPANYLREVLEEEGYTEDDPRYQAEYLGLWAVSTSNLVVDSYSDDRNAFEGSVFDVMAKHPGYHYLLSVKYRFKALSAFVVACYSVTRRHVIFVHSHSEVLMVDEAADYCEDLMDQFPIGMVVVDEEGIGRKFAEEMTQRYEKLSIIPAEKRDERMRYSFVNADLRTGRLQVVVEENARLIDQWRSVLWDADRQKIAAGQESDILAPAGYAHMACRSFFEEPPKKAVDPGEAMENALVEKMRGERMTFP